jgi:hypothetical protein
MSRVGSFHSNDDAEDQNRTGDTAVFSRVLYLLSYLGVRNKRGYFIPNHLNVKPPFW